MAVCDWCNQEMTDPNINGCTVLTFDDYYDDETVYQRIPHGHGHGDCHDCGVKPGGMHHPGCDSETCPKCGEQAISCGNHAPEDDEEEKENEEPSWEEIHFPLPPEPPKVTLFQELMRTYMSQAYDVNPRLPWFILLIGAKPSSYIHKCPHKEPHP